MSQQNRSNRVRRMIAVVAVVALCGLPAAPAAATPGEDSGPALTWLDAAAEWVDAMVDAAAESVEKVWSAVAPPDAPMVRGWDDNDGGGMMDPNG